MTAAPPSSTKLLYSQVVAASGTLRIQIKNEIQPPESVPIKTNSQKVVKKVTTSSNVDDIYSERFQINRRKLQKLLKTETDKRGVNSAEAYFENIMKTTDTYISWPRCVSIDAKRKRDSFVQVFGKQDDVLWAKGLILSTLEPTKVFLKLKIVLSNTDHSFIVGRNSNNLNRIMDQTGTHVQFPDAISKKSNQVMIYGSLEGLKQARVLLRSSTPLLMSFELPARQPPPSARQVESKFNVQVIISSKSTSSSTTIQIKGSSKRQETIKEATKALIKVSGIKQVNKMCVSVQLDIPPQYQDSVKGVNNENLLSIMASTKTKIFFPDLSIRGCEKRRSQVTITGTIDGVCKARHELVQHLPIELTFDIPADNQSKATEIMNLGTKFGVCLTLSQKERDNALAVTIKAAEKTIDKICEVHRDIVQLKSVLPSEEGVPKVFSLLEGAYQGVMDSLVNSYVESVVERTDTTCTDELHSRPAEKWTSSQANNNYGHYLQTNTLLGQFCSTYYEQGQGGDKATYSPDSGHSSEVVCPHYDWALEDGIALESECVTLNERQQNLESYQCRRLDSGNYDLGELASPSHFISGSVATCDETVFSNEWENNFVLL